MNSSYKCSVCGDRHASDTTSVLCGLSSYRLKNEPHLTVSAAVLKIIREEGRITEFNLRKLLRVFRGFPVTDEEIQRAIRYLSVVTSEIKRDSISMEWSLT